MTTNTITLRCEQCEQPFTAPNWKHRDRRFCSKSCSVRYTNAQKFPPHVTLVCEHADCAAPFTVPKWRADQGARYCSRSCAAHVNNENRKADR